MTMNVLRAVNHRFGYASGKVIITQEYDRNSLICGDSVWDSGPDSTEKLEFLQSTGGQEMDEQQTGRRTDELRSAAIESKL